MIDGLDTVELAIEVEQGMPDDVNAYIAKQRALARERQQRSRDRRRNGHVTPVIVDDNGRPSPRLARVAQGILEGKSPSKALKDAGFPHSSHHLLDKLKPVLAEECKALGLTRHKLIQSTVESLEATSPMLTAEGCIQRPDWSARSGGRHDGITFLKLADMLPADASASPGGHVTVTFNSLNVTVTAPDLVDAVSDNDCETLSIEKDSTP